MVLVHALQHEKLMTECEVLSMQSGPSLKTATKERSREARSTHMPSHPTTPRHKFNSFNENGLPAKDRLALASFLCFLRPKKAGWKPVGNF